MTMAGPPLRKLEHNDYTVGWICALKVEYVAAQELLDEEHEDLEYVAQDNNNYTLGSIGKHNVVIATLPLGEYGIASAATVARDMMHSFHNVRIGLMVGIGGGVPSKDHDIRLGDIVVSAPKDGYGGLLQYHHGGNTQDQSFQFTGFLDQPPVALRTALAGLQAQYERKGHRIEETADSVVENNKRLRREYKRPDQLSDRLYRADAIHPNTKEGCLSVCDPQALVQRDRRDEDEDNLVIHYGLIASSNQLMKNALLRDQLAAEKDVLCFEMEAAGLMNHFPCLVIRGICDYSDSHKNDKWQGYAAMVAAAYAKDLLYQIAPNSVTAEKRIRDILSGQSRGSVGIVFAQST
jgi:nucleoside phosphorylase